MNMSLKKLNRLIDQGAAKLAVLQARQDEYLKARTEIHNTMMLQMLTTHELTPETLAELLQRAKTQPIVPQRYPAQKEADHA